MLSGASGAQRTPLSTPTRFDLFFQLHPAKDHSTSGSKRHLSIITVALTKYSCFLFRHWGGYRRAALCLESSSLGSEGPTDLKFVGYGLCSDEISSRLLTALDSYHATFSRQNILVETVGSLWGSGFHDPYLYAAAILLHPEQGSPPSGVTSRCCILVEVFRWALRCKDNVEALKTPLGSVDLSQKPCLYFFFFSIFLADKLPWQSRCRARVEGRSMKN